MDFVGSAIDGANGDGEGRTERHMAVMAELDDGDTGLSDADIDCFKGRANAWAEAHLAVENLPDGEPLDRSIIVWKQVLATFVGLIVSKRKTNNIEDLYLQCKELYLDAFAGRGERTLATRNSGKILGTLRDLLLKVPVQFDPRLLKSGKGKPALVGDGFEDPGIKSYVRGKTLWLTFRAAKTAVAKYQSSLAGLCKDGHPRSGENWDDVLDRISCDVFAVAAREWCEKGYPSQGKPLDLSQGWVSKVVGEGDVKDIINHHFPNDEDFADLKNCPVDVLGSYFSQLVQQRSYMPPNFLVFLLGIDQDLLMLKPKANERGSGREAQRRLEQENNAKKRRIEGRGGTGRADTTTPTPAARELQAFAIQVALGNLHSHREAEIARATAGLRNAETALSTATTLGQLRMARAPEGLAKVAAQEAFFKTLTGLESKLTVAMMDVEVANSLPLPTQEDAKRQHGEISSIPADDAADATSSAAASAKRGPVLPEAPAAGGVSPQEDAASAASPMIAAALANEVISVDATLDVGDSSDVAADVASDATDVFGDGDGDLMGGKWRSSERMPTRASRAAAESKSVDQSASTGSV